MCNAWNHSPECSCGWGGEGHLGRRSTGSLENSQWQEYCSFTGYSSYTNPNARCPVCGASVFFYQSTEGGRVFFDELGPPWPKHPCTSPLGKTIFRPSYSIFSGPVRTYKWQTDGWVPFDIDSIKPQPPMFKVSNIKVSMNGESLSLYSNLKELPVRAPILIKKLEDGLYEISTVQFPNSSTPASEIKFKAYCHQITAHAGEVEEAFIDGIDFLPGAKLSERCHEAVAQVGVQLIVGGKLHHSDFSGTGFHVNSDLKLIRFSIGQRLRTDTPPLPCHIFPAHAGNNFSRFGFTIPAAHCCLRR